MFWSLRENLCGLTHMRRLAARVMLGRSRLYYLENLQRRGFAVEAVLDDRGETLNCRLCGYTNIRFDLRPGFVMTCCSSIGLSVILHHEQLKLWSERLPLSAAEAVEARQQRTSATDRPPAVVKGQ